MGQHTSRHTAHLASVGLGNANVVGNVGVGARFCGGTSELHGHAGGGSPLLGTVVSILLAAQARPHLTVPLMLRLLQPAKTGEEGVQGRKGVYSAPGREYGGVQPGRL